jgi:chitin synthase
LTRPQVAEFISQRRRWLNGSLFASIHATVFWFRIWTSGQNFFRKIILQVNLHNPSAVTWTDPLLRQIEFIYNAVQVGWSRGDHLTKLTLPSAYLQLDISGQLLPGVLLRQRSFSSRMSSRTDFTWMQLVSSATQNNSQDAFKFISSGAGKVIFEVFLKLYIALLFIVVVCSLGNRPQVGSPVIIPLSSSELLGRVPSGRIPFAS